MGAILDVAPKAERFLAARGDDGSVFGLIIEQADKAWDHHLQGLQKRVDERDGHPAVLEMFRATIEAAKATS